MIGFQLETPREVDLLDGQVVTCSEQRQDGMLVGQLAIEVFGAALIIDRDGILEEKACEVIRRERSGRGGASAVSVQLPGASGYRSEAVASAPLPYVYAFALTAYDLALDGGLLVTVRSARADWSAGDHMLRTLRILTRNGMATGKDDGSEEREPILPVVTSGRD